MHRIIDILSAIAVVPLILVLAWFGLLSLLGNIVAAGIFLALIVAILATTILLFKNEHRSLIASIYIIHVAIVGVAVWYLVDVIESPNTDSAYYRPFYIAVVGLPFILITPFIHAWIRHKNVAEQDTSSDSEPFHTQ